MDQEKRNPAPALASGLDRAHFVRNETSFTISSPEREANFVTLYLARRFHIAMPRAQAIAALAQLGERLA
jgi:hypothetical protein